MPHTPSLTIVKDDQERCQEITHALHVAHIQVLPHVAAHDVSEPLEVGGREVPVVAVTSLHILVYAVQI